MKDNKCVKLKKRMVKLKLKRKRISGIEEDRKKNLGFINEEIEEQNIIYGKIKKENQKQEIKFENNKRENNYKKITKGQKKK